MSAPSLEQEALLRVAYHEAGHAVVLAHYGFPIREVRLDLSSIDGAIWRGWVNPGRLPVSTLPDLAAWAVILMAGGAAERLAPGVDPWWERSVTGLSVEQIQELLCRARRGDGRDLEQVRHVAMAVPLEHRPAFLSAIDSQPREGATSEGYENWLASPLSWCLAVSTAAREQATRILTAPANYYRLHSIAGALMAWRVLTPKALRMLGLWDTGNGEQRLNEHGGQP